MIEEEQNTITTAQEETNVGSEVDENFQILKNIFLIDEKNNNEILPFINPSFDLNNLFYLLNTNKTKSKIELLQTLLKIFTANKNLIFLFADKNKKTLFESIINIYLYESFDENEKKIIENLLQFLIQNISIHKNLLEQLYQKIAIYFHKDETIPLSENILLKYLNLFDFFYTNTLTETKNLDENNIAEENNNNENNFNNNIVYDYFKEENEKEIKNYIYFNGYKSKLNLVINTSSSNINTDYPTLENGCSIIFWINLDLELTKKYFDIHKIESNDEERDSIILINIVYGGHQIKLELINPEELIFTMDENIKSDVINITPKFKYNEWNNISFIFSKKTLIKIPLIKLYINNQIFNVTINLPKNAGVPISEKINNITFFENLTGKITSLLYFSYPLDDKMLTYFSTLKSNGFHKIKYLTYFFLTIDKEYNLYTNDKYVEKYKNISKTITLVPSAKLIMDINFASQNIKNLMCILCPFAYDKRRNQIDDIFGNFIGILSMNDGVNNYISYTKNIKQLGGMNNLLPIAELMLLSQKKNRIEKIEKNSLSEKTFLKYLIIIKKILIGKKLNLYDANNRKFFSCLGLFLEKFPPKVFTFEILDIFLEIGKETFQYNDDKETSFHDNFVNMILLNEKIFSKFSDENQKKLWEGVHKFFTSDYLQMKDSFNMSKICLLLKFYDGGRYEKYCCEKHAGLFKLNNKNLSSGEIKDQEIMVPNMNNKISKLFETIQLYMNYLSIDSDTSNLFKLLSLDLSPCLQIKIIQVYKLYFSNQKIKFDEQKKAFENLLKNHFFEIFEYALSVSLLDVRVELLQLIKLIFSEFKDEISKFYTENKATFQVSSFIAFIGDNLLPDNLKVEIIKDNINPDNEKTLGNIEKELTLIINEKKNLKNRPCINYVYKNYLSKISKNSQVLENENKPQFLINFFNEENFETDISALWLVLNDWLTSTTTIQVNKNIKPITQINSFVISFCIEFVSKSSMYYIDSLLIIFYSFLRNETISNREILYSNKNFYPWLIDTIFQFHDNNTELNEKDKDLQENIQKHSIELFKEFIIHRRPNTENEIRLDYILEYSYYQKKNYKILEGEGNRENYINKIGDIGRVVLKTILDSASWSNNLKTKGCFEFMLLFKNSEVFETNNQIEENKNNNEISSNNELSRKSHKKGSSTYADLDFMCENNNDIISNDKQNNNDISFDAKDDKISDDNVSPPNNLKDISISNVNLDTSTDYTNPNVINDDESSHLHSISFDIPKNINSDIINSNKNFNYGEKYILKNNVAVPEEIFDNLFIDEKNYGEADTKPLKEVWKDFFLYDYIIDYYKANIWGIENLCKKVKIEYDGNLLAICKDLIREYGLNKAYKNILLTELYKCLNFEEADEILKIEEKQKLRRKSNIMKKIIKKDDKKDDEKISKIPVSDSNKNIEKKDDKKEKESKKDNKKEKESKKGNKKEKESKKDNKKELKKEKELKTSKTVTKKLKKYEEKNNINVLNMNLILLSVAIDITKNNDEKEFLINVYEQFLLFCVLSSINISSSEKYHNYIQARLYDLIGYGILFLRNRQKEKYNDLLNNLIKPLFDDKETQSTKTVIKNIFTFSKRKLFMHTAIFKLFSTVNKVNTEITVDNPLFLRSIRMTKNKTINLDFPQNINEINDTDLYEETEQPKLTKKDTINKEPSGNIYFVGDVPSIQRNIIEYSFIYFQNEKNKRFNYDDNIYHLQYELKIFYNNDYYSNKDEKIDNEKKRVNDVIYKLIPFFQNQIKKYSSTSYLQENKRRNNYKSIKKRLFSWRGFWSDRYLFYKHPEYLKVKIKNHLTKDMTKILLTPVLDIDYSLPNFSKFDTKKLFNANNYDYKINLDIDNILSDIITNENENLNDIQLKKNIYGFNYLECIYRLTYDKLWEQYKNYDQKPIFDNNISNLDIIKNKDINKNNENIFNCCFVKLTHHIKGFIEIEKSRFKFNYNLTDTKKNLEDSLEEDDISFDKDMGACFGSTFKNKIKDKFTFSIFYDSIQYFFVRNYFYQETGLEIYTISHKNYFFNFKSHLQLQKFIFELLQHSTFMEIRTDNYKGNKILGYSKSSRKNKRNYYVLDKMIEWQNYKISTLEYLMWINIYGGRSFNDLTQYPVFPWLIINYQTEELKPEKDYRNLFLPIGMLDFNQKAEMRKETFIDTYLLIKNDLKETHRDFNYQEFLKKGEDYYENYRNKKLKIKSSDRTLSKDTRNDESIIIDNNIEIVEINQLPSFYGSHYSNPTYVSHYLTRIFPFSFVSIEIQGEKFDDPNRIFSSIYKSFESASSLKDDIRELIPEFYTIPEIFLNKNNLNLAQDKTDANNNKIIINDVELPSWCNNLPFNFVTEKRKLLEKSELKINKWIDMVFGSYQRGEKAEEIHNIFQAQSYEKMVKIENIKDVDMRNALMRLVEVGVTPMQVSATDSKIKLDKKDFLIKNHIYAQSKGNLLDESSKLVCTILESQKYKLICSKCYDNGKHTHNKEYSSEYIYPIINKIVCVSHKLLKIFTNNNYWYTIKIPNLENKNNKGIIEESNLFKYENTSSKYAPSFPMSQNSPFIVYNNQKLVLKAGFWDNRIEITYLPQTPKDDPFYQKLYIPFGGPIVTMEISKDEKYLICGTKFGYIIGFKINEDRLESKCNLNTHSEEITSIAINDNLNMFASASMDGFIMLYVLPSFSLVRSIELNIKFNENDDEFLYADNIFLSSSPLACLSIFISSKKLFKVFSINGEFICEVQETEYTSKINCYVIFSNLEFQEFLIYGTDDGLIKIRSFPFMDLINSVKPFEEQPIISIAISPDNRYCFAWSHSNKIVMIKDHSVSGIDSKEKDVEKKKHIKNGKSDKNVKIDKNEKNDKNEKSEDKNNIQESEVSLENK